jgi:hypothetical protein
MVSSKHCHAEENQYEWEYWCWVEMWKCSVRRFVVASSPSSYSLFPPFLLNVHNNIVQHSTAVTISHTLLLTHSYSISPHPVPLHPIPLHPIKSNQFKSNHIKSNQIKSNQIKSHLIKSKPISSHPILSLHTILSNLIQSNPIETNLISPYHVL